MKYFEVFYSTILAVVRSFIVMHLLFGMWGMNFCGSMYIVNMVRIAKKKRKINQCADFFAHLCPRMTLGSQIFCLKFRGRIYKEENA